jgi:hypothetical protein
MKKCALRQSKDGIIVSFVLHPHEVPKQLQTADIGSRWMVALVELNDDETPVHQPAEEHPEVAARPKGSWRDLQPAAQCAIRCQDPIFRKFLQEKGIYGHEMPEHSSIISSEQFIKVLFGIKSKTELNTDHKRRVLWHQLDDEYQAWKLADVE